MIDDRTNEILALAREEIAVRLAQRTATRERAWRFAFIGFFGTVMLALLLWPGTPGLHWKLYAAVHGVCAQEHNVVVGGLQFPLCARNTGIYGSFLMTCGYLWALGKRRAGKLPQWPITILLLAFIAIMGVDGFNSLFTDLGLGNLYEPQNWLRTLTGIGMGVSIAVLLWLVVNISLRADVDSDQRVIDGPLELAGALAVPLLMMAVMYGGMDWLFWPMAFIAWFGITGVLFVVNLLVTALVMQYDGQVTRLSQLARPGVIALVLTLVMLGAMSAMRFWLEGQGLLSI